MANNPTLTPAALKALIADVMKENHLANPFLTADKPSKGTQIDTLVIKAFKRAGFGTVTPRVDVKTFNRWVADGFRPKEGERATRCKQFRLFHVSQVRPLTAEERAARDSKAGIKPETDTKAVTTVVTKIKPKGKGTNQPSLGL